MTRLLSLLFVLTLSTACIKTAEQVQREKRFERMSEQMKDSQHLVTDLVAQMKDIQSQLDKMNGRLEELEHRSQQVDPNANKKLAEDMTLLKSQKDSETQQLTQIQTELKEQRAFLEKVTAGLAALKESSAAPAKSKKKNAKEEVNAALDLVKSNQYDEAREVLLGLLDHPETTAGDRNKILHGLGRVEFYSKNYDQALMYFSKIYSKYPKASLAPSSLLFIGKSLERMGKKDEAKEAFTKLTQDYPGAKEAGEAKKEL